MDSVPKLLPAWHDITLQQFVRQKHNSLRFSSVNQPDHGGIGLDVNINDRVHCKIPKYSKCQIRFAAEKCALPFLPLRKTDMTDPCLESLKKEKFELEKFSTRVTYMRYHAKRKANSSKLKILQDKLSSNYNEELNDEFSVRIPKTLVELSESIPKRIIVPTFNVAYAGGVLAASNYSDKQNFLHPNSENLSQLCITPLLDGNDQCFVPDFSQQTIISLENEHILQIEQALEGYCCVRQKNSFHMVNMGSKNILSNTTHKAGLFHVATSPFNPLEVLSVYEKGILKLKNLEKRKPLWSVSSDVYNDPFILYPTWRCSFGSHPFSAFTLNEKNLYCFDFREKECAAREIFNIQTNSFHVNEKLMGMKQWNKNPFQHFLTSSHHLILCDERYRKTPVMCWNHCLKDPPLYLEYADFDSFVSIIVIGNQGTQESASFLCSHGTEIQPVSLSPPLLLSSPSDCTKSLKLHCQYVDENISTRLSRPLTGVCIIPNNKEIGFTVLQSTSVGDIFYQDFKQSSEDCEKTYHVSAGCILTPPEKILPHLSELISDSCTDEKISDTVKPLSRMQVNVDKILSSPTEISSNCMQCRISSASDEKELVVSEICPTCNLSSAESQHFCKILANNSVLIGPASEKSSSLDCDMDYLSKFDDTYSKRILSVWLESENELD